MASTGKPINTSTSTQSKKDYSYLWKHEDYWAIWMGLTILVVGLLIFFSSPPANMDSIIAKSNAVMAEESKKAPFKTLEWYMASDAKSGLSGSNIPFAKTMSTYTTRPKGWSDNPIAAFYLSEADAKAKSAAAAAKYDAAKKATAAALTEAKAAQSSAAAQMFKDSALNKTANEKIENWRKARAAESKAKSSAETKPYNLFVTLAVLCIGLGLFFSVGIHVMGRSVKEFLMGFPVVFILAALSYWLAANSALKAWGLEYVLWAILLGFLISNTIGTPKWIQAAAQTEYFIKTGLVLLGSSILMGKILLIGIPGIVVTWLVTPIVLITTFWFGQSILKIESKELNITVSADMSVSGVSAAIAAAAACRAKKEELTLAVGISILFTAIMMVVMPMAIKAMGMHPVLGGAWIGGTVDATGAVVAAGEMLEPLHAT